MNKPFDLADVVRIDCVVSVSRLKLRDNRTGNIEEMVIYHPGDNYPLSQKRRDIESYGYSIISCEAEDTVTGYTPWNVIFDDLLRREKDVR